MSNHDTFLHVRGESHFVDDEPAPAGTLFAAVVASPVAHGRLTHIEVEAARTLPGVRAVLTAADIPGTNQIGGVIKDEPLLAEGIVDFVGQPVALVIATSAQLARRAARAVTLRIDELPAVLDPREAYARGSLIAPERALAIGDVDAAWSSCDVIVEGRVESGAQEHLYLETQAALAMPVEGGGIKVLSGTQAPTVVQRTVAGVLGLAMHRVEVEVRRLGGAFGGKEDQATVWAALAALAAHSLDAPVKLVLRRGEDMRWTGKRHPYSSDFKLGLDRDGRILAYEVRYYQNSGATADLSTAILDRTLFHATNAYYIPNVRASGACCRTNLPPNTAFRGFGGPQAMFVLESAIVKAADALGVEAAAIQGANLLAPGDRFPCGMRFANPALRRSWELVIERSALERLRSEIATFNAEHRLAKRGVALMPVCFGISFTTTFMNQAAALVHIYTDGSVSVSTAAVEMGQGTNTKIRHVAARTLAISIDRVRVDTTTTSRVANTSPTAASTGPDMNGHATRLACLAILARLRECAAQVLSASSAEKVEIRDERVLFEGQPTNLDWKTLVTAAYQSRISLSAQAHYATPGIYFDRSVAKGEPFAYHVVGTAVVTATVDCLRGTATVDDAWIVHDLGRSLDLSIDRGQAEGGLAQGIGWLTMEEIQHDERGRLRTDNLTTYKIPDVYSVPASLDLLFLADDSGPAGIMGAKATGEPPFMYGIGAYFAILAAMRAYNPELPLLFSAPITPEKILMALHPVPEVVEK